jgi:hypothetical protein
MRSGASGGSRTHDPLLRRQMLYPTELQTRPFTDRNLQRLILLRINFWILSLYTGDVQGQIATSKAAKSAKDWQKTPYANLIRYVPPRAYYARLRVKGKLIRKRLNTDLISVAKLRLSDLEKVERQRSESVDAAATGKMMYKDAITMRAARRPALNLV